MSGKSTEFCLKQFLGECEYLETLEYQVAEANKRADAESKEVLRLEQLIGEVNKIRNEFPISHFVRDSSGKETGEVYIATPEEIKKWLEQLRVALQTEKDSVVEKNAGSLDKHLPDDVPVDKVLRLTLDERAQATKQEEEK